MQELWNVQQWQWERGEMEVEISGKTNKGFYWVTEKMAMGHVAFAVPSVDGIIQK